jgi:hypothetical protein
LRRVPPPPAAPPATKPPAATIIVERRRTPAPDGGFAAEPEVSRARALPTLVPGGLKVPSTPTGDRAADATPEACCPRCGGLLIDASSLGLCRDCGYCRLLEEDAAKAKPKAPEAPKPVSALGLDECLDLVAGLPTWVWVLLIGELVAVGVSLAGQMVLREEIREYTVWYSVQAGMGLVAILAAQLWALMLVAPEDGRLGPLALFLPARLWWVAFRKLPATRWPVWVGTWGLTLLIGAAVVFAGRVSWSQLFKTQPPPDKSEPRTQLIRPQSSLWR